MHNLEEIYKKELKFLKDGIHNSKNPYHTFTLSSINGLYPESRTVVLRDFDTSSLKIYFNADYRSSKVKEFKNNHYCCALFYDQKRRVQLRFKCEAVLNHQNDVSNGIWKNTPLQSRKCYMGPYSPSKALDDWHPNIPLEYLKMDPEEKHSEEGYANFTHIELKVIELDVLELHHDGHIRFKTKDGIDFCYIAP